MTFLPSTSEGVVPCGSSSSSQHESRTASAGLRLPVLAREVYASICSNSTRRACGEHSTVPPERDACAELASLPGVIHQAALAAIDRAEGRPVDKRRVLAIGDGLPTDIKGAWGQGIDVLMVPTAPVTFTRFCWP